jgi:hypothetical protein
LAAFWTPNAEIGAKVEAEESRTALADAERERTEHLQTHSLTIS